MERYKFSIAFTLTGLILVIHAIILRSAFFSVFESWCSLSLICVGASYFFGSPSVFGKKRDGGIYKVNFVLLLPYFLYVWGVWYIMRLLSKEENYNYLDAGIWIGRRLVGKEVPDNIELIVDLTSEFAELKSVLYGRNYICLPVLDGYVPKKDDFIALLKKVNEFKCDIYIHCAEGHGRTGLVAAALLILKGKAESAEEALQKIKLAREKVNLNSDQYNFLSGMINDIRDYIIR
ncbi:MAG TPA: dual specificity protein phosphatase family protein [Clostridia bacterium]